MVTETITPVTQPIVSNITLPGSKSITNRAILLAALAIGTSELSGVLFSDDTLAALSVLQALGVAIEVDQQRFTCRIQGVGGEFLYQQAELYCHESGTLTRFLLPILAACSGLYRVSAAPSMMARPLAPLLKVLAAQGSEFSFEAEAWHMPFELTAQGLSGGALSVPLAQSSQFVSGLLMAAPYAKAPLQISTGDIARKPYIKMTIEMMAAFGCSVAVNAGVQATEFEVPLGRYQAQNYAIEPDASTASYFFAMAALTQGRVTVQGLHANGLQGDLQFLMLLEKMGCAVEWSDHHITVQGPAVLRGLGKVSLSGFSDTFMTLAALVVFADAPTTLTGLAHTRLQESDRVTAMATELARLGVAVTTTEDSLTIEPGVPIGRVVQGHNDHRIAMSLALVGLKVPGLVIEGAECVAKTCPDYFARLAELTKIH